MLCEQLCVTICSYEFSVCSDIAALNEALTAEVHRLKLVSADLRGESASNCMPQGPQQGMSNNQMLQMQRSQYNMYQLQQHQQHHNNQKQQQTQEEPQQNQSTQCQQDAEAPKI